MFLDATESWTFPLEDLHNYLACSSKSDCFWCRWMSWNVVKVVSFHTRLYDIQNGQKWPRPLLKRYSSLAGHLIEILYWKYFLGKFVCSRTTICREMSWKLTEMLLGQLDRCKLTRGPPNTLTSRHTPAWRMILNIPNGGIESLPNTVQVGLIIWCPRCPVRWCLRCCCSYSQ